MTRTFWDSQCDRCERCQMRDGVVVSIWHFATRVLVMGLRSTPDAQILGQLPVHIQRACELVVESGVAKAREVAGDTLVACGLASDVSGDEVAACSARHRLQTAPRLQGVVLLGRQAHALATLAGLVREGLWEPWGARSVRCEVADNVDDVPEVAADLLKARPPKQRRPKLVNLLASELLSVLPSHTSHQVKRAPGMDWKTKPGPLKASLLEQHLRGHISVGPGKVGDWPYVVLDVDVHNVLQKKHFEDTVSWIAKTIPSAFLVRSSISGGVHAYLRVPKEISYERAARFLRAFVALNNKHWLEHKDRRLVAEAIEVPSRPTRLPFGPGSQMLSSELPLSGQVESFVLWLQQAPCTDFENARRFVARFVANGGIAKWTPAQRYRLREHGNQPPERPLQRLSPEDPWQPIVKELRTQLHVRDLRLLLQAIHNGIESFGTRHRITVALVHALADIVDEARARELMAYWLQHRDHQSVDIRGDRAGVLEDIETLIVKEYSRGVPESIWLSARTALESAYRQELANRTNTSPVPPWSSVEKTAFFVLKNFYAKGVGQRVVVREELEQFAGDGAGAFIRPVLVSSYCLRKIQRHIPGKQASVYGLSPNYWPPPVVVTAVWVNLASLTPLRFI